MLYSLFQLLPDFPGSRLMTYISFRAIVAAVLALLISIYFGKYFIAFMKRKHITEVQRDEKTDPFNVAKKGVPTMGGIVIIFSILLPVVLIGNLSNIYLLLMLITTPSSGHWALPTTTSKHSAATKTGSTDGSR